MIINTIGFTRKSAEQFFDLLKLNKVTLLLDTRLNNVSQLAGFAKGKDLQYFCKVVLGIEYIHDVRFAPSEKILNDYRDKKISWDQYELEYINLLNSRDILGIVNAEYLGKLNGICILCSEELPQKCHRRVLADFLKENIQDFDVKINHLF
jgi:uncharacterized protein (DUF488 family)